MNNYCVYSHSRKSDGKLFYIGKGKPSRPRSPSGRSAYWHRIVEKHGFTIKIIKSGMNEECALSFERALIAAIGRENLCNHTDGGDGCRNPSKETRKKMSDAKIGLVRSEETIEKWRQKVLGRIMPRDAIEKTRAAHIGSKRTKEAKQKMSATHRARWEIIKPPIKTLCVETGEIHSSPFYASLWLKENGWPKASPVPVYQACQGKRKTAYGYRWEYA